MSDVLILVLAAVHTGGLQFPLESDPKDKVVCHCGARSCTVRMGRKITPRNNSMLSGASRRTLDVDGVESVRIVAEVFRHFMLNLTHHARSVGYVGTWLCLNLVLRIMKSC